MTPRSLGLAAVLLVAGVGAAAPAGVEATGGSYVSCRRGSARVFWAEHGE